jgi:hypothetical protein
MRNYVILGVIIFLHGIPNKTYAQNSLNLSSNYIYSFGNSTSEFQGNTYKANTTSGYEITLNYLHDVKKTDLQTVLELGYRHIFFSGSSDELVYSGELMRLTGTLGCNYLVNKKLHVGGLLEIENNMDLDETYTGRGDLYRYSVSLEAGYKILNKLTAAFLINRAFYPISKSYTIFNPQNQLRLGLTYTILQ